MSVNDKLAQAVNILRETAQPSKIILFGSHARGDARPDSDYDFMVVKKDVPDRRLEMVRLRRALSPLRLPVDVLVASEATFDYWAETPGNIYFEVFHDGKVLYEKP